MDVEKTIEFILEQQAQLVSSLNHVTDGLSRVTDGLNQLSDGLNRLNRVVLDLATSQERTSAIVETLAERHVDLAERHAELHADLVQSRKELVEHHKELAEQQKITEQNLNALILAVERHIVGHGLS